MRKWKAGKLAGVLVAVSMMTAAVASYPVLADAERVVTLGANLSESEQNAILKYFGASRSSVNVIYVTNDEERALLSSYIPLEVIGTNTLSCAYVKPTSSGGIQVKTANLTWVTSNMIASALSTSGVRNCEVIAACPRPVSGTGALTGVLKAYEYASGQTLDPTKKTIAAQEITTTTDVADTVGQAEATQIVNDIKLQIIEEQVEEFDEAKIQQIVDDAVAKAVESIQAERDELLELTNEQKEALNTLAENIAAQQYKYEDVKDTLERVEQNVSVNPEINVNVNVNNGNEVTTGDTEVTTGDTETTVQNELPEDSILLNTDVTALGGDVITDATTEEAIQPIEEAEMQEDEGLPFEIQTTEEGSFGGEEIAQTEPAAEPEITDSGTTEEPQNEEFVDIFQEEPADEEQHDEPVYEDADAVPEQEDVSTEPENEEPAADEEPAAQEESAPAPALVFDSSDRSFNSFGIRLYTDSDLVPSSGAVVVTQDGAEVKRIDLQESSSWGVVPVESSGKLDELGFSEGCAVYALAQITGLEAGTYHVNADIVFAEADDSGKPKAGTERESVHAEADLTYVPSGITVMDVSGDAFSTPTAASVSLQVPEGTASVALWSSDEDVASVGEYDFDLGAAELILDEPGEVTITADYYDEAGELIGSDSLKIAAF